MYKRSALPSEVLKEVYVAIEPKLTKYYETTPTGACDRLNVSSAYVILTESMRWSRLNNIALPVYDIAKVSDLYHNVYPNKPCTSEGHIMRNGSCVRTIHAEMHAMLDLNKDKLWANNHVVIFSTHEPCIDCSKHISGWGDKLHINTVLYQNEYGNKFTKAPEEEYTAIRNGIPYVDLSTL